MKFENSTGFFHSRYDISISGGNKEQAGQKCSGKSQ